MFLSSLFESKTQRPVKVIYSGRFQPFHKGHAAVYQHLVKNYGSDNVFIVTSNKTDSDRSPFSFDEKRQMMVLTGIDASKVVQSTQPYRAMEIVSTLSPDTVLLFAVSAKDMAEDPRFSFAPKKDGSPSYFQPFKDLASCQGLDKAAYMITVPTFEFTVLGKPATSASQIRAQFAAADENTQKKIVTDLFGKFDNSVYSIMRSKLGQNPVTENADDALHFATTAHAGQTRSGGDPYKTHPVRVADSVKKYKKSQKLDALIQAALLHDTIEDTNTTYEDLETLFGGLVASLVKELTSDSEQIQKMGKANYLAHKMANMSSYALVIKLADRLDNIKDIATAKTPEWREKYKNETLHILDHIESNRRLSKTHRVFIDLIRKKLGELTSSPVTESKLIKNEFTVADFKIARFESWADYTRFLSSPKSSKRDTVWSWPSGVAKLLSPSKSWLLSESKSTKDDRALAQQFSTRFKQLDHRDAVVIKKGNSISVLSSILDLDKKSVEIRGFATPKKIAAINTNNDGSIDVIEFDDGSQFPERNELTNVLGKDITNTIFFANENESTRAYTEIWMMMTRMEGNGWDINNQLSESNITEDGYTYSTTDPVANAAEAQRIADLKKLYGMFNDNEERARYLDSVGLLKATKKEKEFLHKMTDANGRLRPRTSESTQGKTMTKNLREYANDAEYYESFEQWQKDVRRFGGDYKHGGDGCYYAHGIDGESIGRWDERTGEGWIDASGDHEYMGSNDSLGEDSVGESLGGVPWGSPQKPTSAHQKEIARKRMEYEKSLDQQQAKRGETYHYGKAVVTKPPVEEDSALNGEKCNYEVTYDIYGSNREVPLYTKTRKIKASSEKEAEAIMRKLVGGTNYRVKSLDEEQVTELSVGTLNNYASAANRHRTKVSQQHQDKYDPKVVNKMDRRAEFAMRAYNKAGLDKLLATTESLVANLKQHTTNGDRVAVAECLTLLKPLFSKLNESQKQVVSESLKKV
jgi:glycerol-3-phosphate cytidylyltransferase-like family protein